MQYSLLPDYSVLCLELYVSLIYKECILTEAERTYEIDFLRFSGAQLLVPSKRDPQSMTHVGSVILQYHDGLTPEEKEVDTFIKKIHKAYKILISNQNNINELGFNDLTADKIGRDCSAILA